MNPAPLLFVTAEDSGFESPRDRCTHLHHIVSRVVVAGTLQAHRAQERDQAGRGAPLKIVENC